MAVFLVVVGAIGVSGSTVENDHTVAQAGAQQQQTNLGSDANGNPLRRAIKTGHVSNYDESKVKPYTLPDPLVFADGTPALASSLPISACARAGRPATPRISTVRSASPGASSGSA